MIRVARPALPIAVQEALEKRGLADNKTELENARAYYGQIPPPGQAFKFIRYKEWAVCYELDTLFYEKCAYCESRYRAVDSRDIEHYRPKGGVTESPSHRGYWWLAAVWCNLLPSCPPCNQRRHQAVFDPGMTLEEFELALLKKPARLTGKANSFPVRNGNWVTTEKEDITFEDPLLINPCERDPEDHLEFVFDWNRERYIWEADQVTALVRPKSNAGEDDCYARASIAIYGLNRAGLIRERAARVKDLQLLCQPVVDVIRDIANSPSSTESRHFEARLRRYRSNLSAFARADQPYAGMVRAFLLQFEEELKRLEKDVASQEKDSKTAC